MRRFAGQVALITGGARGIGFGIARRLSAEGAALALLDVAGERLARRGRELARRDATVLTLPVNVTDREAVEEAVGRVAERFGRIDVLITAAGINGRTDARTHEVLPADFDRVLDVNLRGMFLCIRAVLPVMLAANYGRIVNIASISGKVGNLRMLPYSTSKAAVIGMTKVIGKEYAATGITCNAIAPALVRTPATEQAHGEAGLRELTAAIPMRRPGEIEEIAAVVAFAASREASFTTGFVFDASGGRAVY
ncbi:MAG: SDR family oxidoreductase [SAR324 cluster bacterium]|nr:SDR family oxidoreductase [SAR324 cluster bacterium]MCZ6747857.1 SDR family NAD(P)-dependent oxidoreductase [SAR324 cluster bacterium]